MSNDLGNPRHSDDTLRTRAAAVIPGGMYGHVNLAMLPEGYPQFFGRGRGCRIWDVDGNEYVDLVCSTGAIVLGHHHPKVEEAAQAQLVLADCQNGPAPVMVELAELLVDRIQHADWAMFAKNGSDVTTLCLTIARAATGRRKVLVAANTYHGAAPWSTPKADGTTPDDRANIIEFVYNDLASVTVAADRAGGDLAAVIVTPFRHEAAKDQELVDPTFARGLRKLCDARGAVLILDEVRVGLRLSSGGSWEHLGVAPDLSAWSKALGNGYPIAAITGSDALRDGATLPYVTGSFWFSAVPMAAAMATIVTLGDEDGVARMERSGNRLRAGLQSQADANRIAVSQTGPVQMPYLRFHADTGHERERFFARTAMQNGAYFHPRHNWFLSAAHRDSDVDRVLEATDAAFASVRREFGED